MMKSKRLSTSVGVVTALLAFFAGSEAMSQGLKTITFVQPSPSAINSFQVYVAIGEGYFKDEGLDVRPQAIDGSGPVLQALASGQDELRRERSS